MPMSPPSSIGSISTGTRSHDRESNPPFQAPAARRRVRMILTIRSPALTAPGFPVRIPAATGTMGQNR